MPLHTPRFPRLRRIAALAVAISATAGATGVVTAAAQTAPNVGTTAERGHRYHDIEANKAASMHALSRHTSMRHTVLSPARIDAAAHAATIRAIGAALAK